MMGRGAAQANEAMDLGGLLELVGDDQRYKAKLEELQALVNEASRIREIALQTNMKAEENRRAVREMLEQAKTARAETLGFKQEQEKLVALSDRRQRDVEAIIAQHNETVEHYNRGTAETEARLTAREQACQTRELAVGGVEQQAAQLVEQAKLDAAKMRKDTAESSQRVNDAVNAAFAEAEHAKQEALRIKDVIAQKHAKYNEFVMSLAD